MKRNFLSRLEKLEAITAAIRLPLFRYGYLTPLPKDYVGERHVVRVEQTPAEGADPRWCKFEERPGPEPPERPMGLQFFPSSCRGRTQPAEARAPLEKLEARFTDSSGLVRAIRTRDLSIR
jgi:hypothetical protein